MLLSWHSRRRAALGTIQARLLVAGFSVLVLVLACKEDAADAGAGLGSGMVGGAFGGEAGEGGGGQGGRGGVGGGGESGVPMVPVGGSLPVGGERPDAGEGGVGGGVTTLRPLTNAISLARQCAVVEGGSVWCWGSNVNGLLGLADDTVSVPFAIRVPNIDNAVRVSTHGRHACALLADATVKCWGHTLGGLGNPDAVANAGRISLPVPVQGLSGVVLLEAGPDVSGLQRIGWRRPRG